MNLSRSLSFSRQVVAVSNVLLVYGLFKAVPQFFFGFPGDRYGCPDPNPTP